jgi:hypothetical protein
MLSSKKPINMIVMICSRTVKGTSVHRWSRWVGGVNRTSSSGITMNEANDDYVNSAGSNLSSESQQSCPSIK